MSLRVRRAAKGDGKEVDRSDTYPYITKSVVLPEISVLNRQLL